MQKMRRYIKAFANDDKNKNGESEKTDKTKESPNLRSKKFSSMGKLSGWQLIRLSALGYEMEKQLQGEGEDI